MGWASGGELADEIWEIIAPEIDPQNQQDVARDIWRAFEDRDCDVLEECEELSIAAGYDFADSEGLEDWEEGVCTKLDCEDQATHSGTIRDGDVPVLACDRHAHLLDNPEPL